MSIKHLHTTFTSYPSMYTTVMMAMNSRHLAAVEYFLTIMTQSITHMPSISRLIRTASMYKRIEQIATELSN